MLDSPLVRALGPIVLIIALGATLFRSGFLGRAQLRDIDRLTYWVGVPCLLFAKIATAPVAGTAALRLSIVLVAATLVTASLAALAARLGGLSAGARGPFVQAAFRGNLAFVGLSIVLFGLAPQDPARAERLELLAVLSLAPLVLLYNILAVLTLLIAHHGRGRRAWGRVLGSLLANPLVLSCAAGLAWSALAPPLPAFAAAALGAVGQMALPLALLSLGGSLLSLPLGGEAGRGILAATFKTGLMPAATWSFGRALALPPEQLRIALVFAACPTAVLSHVLVGQLGGSRSLAAAAIVASTALSVLSLGLVLSFA